VNVLEERRLGIWNKLQSFRDLQHVYMPGALRCIKKEDEMQMMNDDEPPNPELVKLWLPSELPEDERRTGCTGNLVEMEGKL
jgi:hypothetical protein